MGYELKSNKISLPRWQQRMAAAVRLRYTVQVSGSLLTNHDYRVRQFLYCTVVYRLPHRRQHLRSQQQLWVSATTQVLAGCNFFIGSRTTMQVSAILHRLPHRRQHLGRQQQHQACAATQVLAGCHLPHRRQHLRRQQEHQCPNL